MKKACAWCGMHLDGEPNDPETTHGMCPACREREKAKVRELLEQGMTFR